MRLGVLILAALAMVLAATIPGTACAARKTIRAAMESGLSVLDPIVSTSTITNMHAMMVYDTLFALDEELRPRPLMVGRYQVSEDGLAYTFELRDRLAFSDGAPITAEDCVASIRRWGAKDRAGQQMLQVTDSLTAVDERTIRLVLKEPWGQVLHSLAKVSANYPAIMPKRLAETDPDIAVTDPTGSGPFAFVPEEWVPGARAVYVRNPHYVPRQEPPSGMAGGREVKVDRVEFVYTPDPHTALVALMAGEIDLVQNPLPDYLSTLTGTSGVGVRLVNVFGHQGIVRLNHLQPPFDNPKMRQGVIHVLDQSDMLAAAVGKPEFYRPCRAIFGCWSPLASDDGAPPLTAPALDKARALFQEAGYDGSPIVILDPVDRPDIHGPVTVLADALRAAGLRVEQQPMDFATMIERRARKGPPSDGGWHIFLTHQTVLTASTPMNNLGLAANCGNAWPGWPCDDRIERLRADWTRTTDDATRKDLARMLQRRAYDVVTYIPYGEWLLPIAYRTDRLEGFVRVPINIAFWNIRKK